MRLRLQALKAEGGTALVLVVFLTAALTLTAVSLTEIVRGDASRGEKGVVRDAAFQAAEAGLDDYTSKLLDDNQYFLHDVALGESTRRSSGGTLVSPGATPTTWLYGTTWTYPNGKNNWRQLTNGYEYNLQINAPTSTNQFVDIFATGRKQGTTSPARVIEERLRPSSVADFLMMTNSDYSVGSAATTYGKIYAGIDSSGVAHNVDHQGTSYGNIYAEGNITGNPNMQGGALKYDHNTIRTVIKSPISFTSFASSLVDIQRAAQLSGIYLNNAAKDAWQLTFNSNGTVDVKSCTKSGGNPVGGVAPVCGTATNYPVPANGAIYAEQTAVIAGGSSSCDGLTNANCVNGRVTVASNQDIVVGDDLGHVQDGDDVLGLIARNDVIIAQWAPSTTWWRAAVVAQYGRRHSYSSDGSHTLATFTGSVASNLGPYMDMFQNRVYNYDPNLMYLQPPWFPTINYAYTVLLFRELPG